MESDVSQAIKADLSQARKYAEGRGIRIEVRGKSIVYSIRKLVDFKLMY